METPSDEAVVEEEPVAKATAEQDSDEASSAEEPADSSGEDISPDAVSSDKLKDLDTSPCLVYLMPCVEDNR